MMNYLIGEFKEAIKGDPPWFTELLSTLQEKEGLENLGIANVKWDEALTYLYGFKDTIIERFNEYFALYEIGQETPARFQFMCNRHYNANKRKWDYWINLYLNNLTTQIGRLNKTIKTSEIVKAITGKEIEARTGRDSINGLHENEQGYDVERETKNYNTPVTQVQSLNDGYLSGGTGDTSKTDVLGTNKITDTTDITRNGTKDTTKDDNTKEDTVLEYQFYDKPVVELIEENFKAWNDFIQSIINDCKELFINVTARI